MQRRTMATRAAFSSSVQLGNRSVGDLIQMDTGPALLRPRSSFTVRSLSGSVMGTASESGARRERVGFTDPVVSPEQQEGQK